MNAPERPLRESGGAPPAAGPAADRIDLMIVIHSLRGGGAERVAVDLAAAWRARGCRVMIVTQTDDRQDAYPLPDGVRRHALGLAGESAGPLGALWGNLLRVAALRRLVRRHRPAVVLGMMTRGSVLAVLAARGRSRVIATEHAHPPSLPLPAFWERLRRWTYPRADAVIALTRGTAQWLDAHLPGVRAQVIPNAVRWPLADGEPVLEPPPAPGRRRLLAVGRLHPVKGFDGLLRAFAQLAGPFPDWDLTILGEGEQRGELEALRDGLGLAGRVSLPGRVGNMAAWYGASDLYVLSSQAEGLSNTLIEAMACGLPCVATDCDTGPREIIREGLDGLLVRPIDDPDALAAGLATLMADAGLRARLAGRAVDARDRFGTARIMALWEQVFQGRRVN
ncbi:Glycosyl transferase, group 1 family protein [Castellaniella defragrans 65Phen]|uniref:Glycosyl transferase, group 1 family protein n=3 Tax=Castellaniella defragrans TaxID=75697 RepID=W8X0Y0_CASD6|nr:glycosyltransferase involved in cell wall biosynthesis [Castellaniella defragrans]CDM25723.1 Glycosyl transferase, group 1 family protein [Castellaniella defragrans 65Phen]